jgi:membrane protein required for beta-lactamase induction
MTLISILLGLALEYFAGPLDRFRKFDWFDRYFNWLEANCQRMSIWDGAGGVVLTLALPVLLLLLLAWVLAKISILLPLVLAIVVFIYSLGPNLNTLLSNYTQALEGNIEEDIALIENKLNLNTGTGSYNSTITVSSLLLRAHEHIFGVVFWFIVLGMSGSLIYCLTILLKQKFDGVHGGYAMAVHDLHLILMWPSSRLLSVSFALSGSLVDTLEAWRKVPGDTFRSSPEVIVETGLGALQYEEGSQDNDIDARKQYIQWIKEAQALINRTLIIWLTVLGILTIGGTLS